MFGFGLSFGMLWCREFRNHRRTVEKPQHWKFETKTYHCAFLILLQQDRGHGFTTGFTTYRKYPLVEQFLSLKVYVVGIIPVCQKANILYEHMYDLLYHMITCTASILYYMNTCMTSYLSVYNSLTLSKVWS